MENLEKVRRALLCMQRQSWEQGMAAQAAFDAGDCEDAVLLCREALYRSLPDGRMGMLYCDLNNAVDCCLYGEPFRRAAAYTGDPAFQDGVRRLERWITERAPRSPAGGLYHMLDAKTYWADSFDMAPPFLAMLGRYDDALRQLSLYWDALYLPESGLLGQIWDDGRGTFERRGAWGVGDGWAMVGILRVLLALPPEREAERALWLARLRGLVDAALRRRLPGGLFPNILDDPASFPEANFAQMLCYTVFRGAARGLFGAETVRRAADVRLAVLPNVDADGVVRNVCGAPSFDKPGVAPEAQAFHLMMEAAWRGLEGKE